VYPNRFYGRPGDVTDIPSIYGTSGINGIGGGGAGAHGTVGTDNNGTNSYIVPVYKSLPKDGAGRGGLATSYSTTGVDDSTVQQEWADGGDAINNTGAGGGGGGFVYRFDSLSTDRTPYYIGKGGKGGSGLVIIMW
jgi:hypothetical protein